nr:xylulose kinase-1 [Tanacetum cinerariifolium]
MVAYLTKSNASEGFNNLIDFFHGSSIKYALIVNPNIYVSCIKQFWTTVAVKKLNDIIRLQALVDKKKVVVTEATIRDALYLDDTEGVECLPNEEIFPELTRIGYGKPSTKLISSMASAVICLLSGKGFSGVETPLFEGMLVAQEVGEGDANENVENVNAGDAAEGDVSAAHDEVPTADEEPFIPSPTPPSPPPHLFQDIPSTLQVQPTPPQSPQVQPQSPQPQPPPTQDAEIHMNLLQEVIDTYTALTRRVKHLALDKIAQALEITKLKRRVKKLERRNKGRMISDMDADVNVVLEEAKEVDVDNAKADQDSKADESVDIQGRKAESQAEIYKIDLDHANKVLSMQEEESKPTEVQEVVDVVTTAKLITKVVTAASTTISAVDVPYPAAITVAASKLTAGPSRRTKGAKEDPAVKRYQALKRNPHTEAQTRKNMMIYLKNVVGFKMDYFKGMSYDDIRPIFERYFDSSVAFLQKTKEHIEEEESRALKKINETPAEKAAKRQKLDKEVEELKRHLQIVPNEDDVYTEATSLARKVPVVDYESLIRTTNRTT